MNACWSDRGISLLTARERTGMWASSLLETYCRGELMRPSGRSARGEIPRVHRDEVWNVTGGICAYCGKQTAPFVDFSIDHFVPLAHGGMHSLPNMIPCCTRCNAAKRDRMPEEWFEIRDNLYLVEVAIEYYKAVVRLARRGMVVYDGPPLWLTSGLVDIEGRNRPPKAKARNRSLRRERSPEPEPELMLSDGE